MRAPKTAGRKDQYLIREKIYLTSLDIKVMVEFEFVRDEDERGGHEDYVFHSFKTKQSYPTASDSVEELKLWCDVEPTAKQILEIKYALDELRIEWSES